MDYDKLVQAAKGMGQLGSAMDPNPNGMARRMGNEGVDLAQAELMRREMKRQQEEEEKKKRGGVFRKAGSALGTIAGTVLSGGNPVIGAAIGSAIGGAAGSAAGGTGIDPRAMLQDAATGGFSAFAAPRILEAMGLGSQMAAVPDAMGMKLGNMGAKMGLGAADLGYKVGNATGQYLMQSPFRENIRRLMMGEQDPYADLYGIPQY
jgi:hypothetical protein